MRRRARGRSEKVVQGVTVDRSVLGTRGKAVLNDSATLSVPKMFLKKRRRSGILLKSSPIRDPGGLSCYVP